ncbi:Nitrosoguanidine resistance protein SNG1 [Candida viswanathii]|uniref:Nitrosoguanidine resistance protein SNG1 n=1 Tax=Candida viswanathii TaxID=5486 RepID=A0A367YLJ9_9ASCO|nr:Nitrosoguanidine resistance protein SNG1 [Candida viswanathii]
MPHAQDSSTDSKGSALPRSSSENSEPSVEHYTPSAHLDHRQLEAQEEEQEEIGEPVSRQSTMLQRLQSRHSFFSDRIQKQRTRLYLSFLKVYLIIAIGCLGVFSIYWGSFYRRDTRTKNLRMLVVLEDQEIDNIPPIYGNQMRELLATPYARLLGDWHIFNNTEFEQMALEHNNTVEEEVIRQIHHQQYWSSIYVKQNTSYDIYNALANGQFFNASNATYSYYETGRHLTSMSIIVLSVEAVQSAWLDSNLVMTEIIRLGNVALDNENSINTVTQSLGFQFVDRIPLTNDVLIASLQIGLLYLVIVSFFSFNFFDTVHKSVAQLIKKPHFLLYRTLSSVVSYFVISLMFGLVTLAFQVDFTVTFGKSGFLVYWMVTFLTMWTVGLASELAALMLIPIYPPLLGFWLIFWVIVNITPSFTPIALLPQFYRYGYAMPLHNAFEIYCVIFFNTYKGQFGRNIGIIFAWVVVLTALTPLTLIYFGKAMAKKAAKAAQAAEKEK